jgi:hypothetical protein
MASLPELPPWDVPELKTRIPLVPWAPELADLIVIAPLVEATPSPLSNPTEPPVSLATDCPAAKVSRPPEPELPRPRLIARAPPLPPAADAEPKDTDPVLPELEVPELNTRMPVTPFAPALAL